MYCAGERAAPSSGPRRAPKRRGRHSARNKTRRKRVAAECGRSQNSSATQATPETDRACPGTRVQAPDEGTHRTGRIQYIKSGHSRVCINKASCSPPRDGVRKPRPTPDRQPGSRTTTRHSVRRRPADSRSRQCLSISLFSPHSESIARTHTRCRAAPAQHWQIRFPMTSRTHAQVGGECRPWPEPFTVHAQSRQRGSQFATR